MFVRLLLAVLSCFAVLTAAPAAEIRTSNQPAQLDIRQAGEHSIRVTLRPLSNQTELPFSPALAPREYAPPVISLREMAQPVRAQVGSLNVEVRADPLTVVATTRDGKPIQTLAFQDDGMLSFQVGGPVLGLGEGGPLPRGNFRTLPVEFDRRGRLHNMRPRWQSDAYGSRNPVAMLIGTEGWGLFIATPWGQVDLRDTSRGVFTPWQPPAASAAQKSSKQGRANLTAQLQGRPPPASIVPGVFDLFLFDAHDPLALMNDISLISGPAVMPPKWSLGYMQSHRELVDKNLSSEALLLNVVDTFREKKIPLDAVIYLGTGSRPPVGTLHSHHSTSIRACFSGCPRKCLTICTTAM
jgi:alpha-glucosidase/alpha-D-xyloside xylohydrolase